MFKNVQKISGTGKGTNQDATNIPVSPYPKPLIPVASSKKCEISKTIFDDKINDFQQDIRNKKEFEEKIKTLFISEFEEKIVSILLTKELEFMSSLSTSVKMELQSMYTLEIFEEKSVREIFDKCEKFVRKEYYAKTHRILTTSWNDYEINLQAIKKYSSYKDKLLKISSKNQEHFSFLKSYRKHCKNSDTFAFHNCNEGAKMLEVYDETKDSESGRATHVVCIECKSCYLTKCIQLNCNHCKLDYFSSILENGENPDLQPATWQKYHCGMFINDKMRCLKCKQVLYLNLKTDTLTCFNKVCRFEAKPKSIMWVCVMCKKEFNSEAKIYNPLDFKPIRNAIQLAISLKQRARPHSIPCCDGNVYSKVFYHKKECSGEVYLGRLENKPIVVCSKCKSMNFYEKFTWTCPLCNNRFQDLKEKESKMDCSYLINDSNTDTARKSISFFNEKEKFGSTPIKSNFDYRGNVIPSQNKVIPTKSSNYQSEYKKSPVMTSNKNVPIQIEKDDLNESRISVKTDLNSSIVSKRHKTLMDVLQERRGSVKKESFTPGLTNNLNERDDVKRNLSKEFVRVLPDDLESNVNTNQKIQILHEEEEKISGNSSSALNRESKHDVNNSLNQNNNIIGTPSEAETKILKTVNDSNLAIENFKIIKQIGEGSYGKIYLIEDKSKNQYAMKKIIAHDQDELAAIRKEFELLNSIEHSNIMKIYGIIEKTLDITTYVLYIIMERAIGDWDAEIRERLEKKNPYTEEELLTIIKQLVNALAFLQNNKISHRDLKPLNILVFENNVYKLGDFGEAKKSKISRELYSLRGTEIYMSPILFESLKESKEDVTHNVYKSDVFSLGYCLLHAATMSFQSINEVRELKNMKSTIVVLNKYLKSKYSAKLICLLVKMIDVYERTRLDFIDLEKYINEKIFSS